MLFHNNLKRKIIRTYHLHVNQKKKYTHFFKFLITDSVRDVDYSGFELSNSGNQIVQCHVKNLFQTQNIDLYELEKGKWINFTYPILLPDNASHSIHKIHEII